MGIFYVDAEIGDPQGTRYETVRVLVDCGATHTALPKSVLERLGVVPETTRPFKIADGSDIERPVGYTRMRLGGESIVTPVAFCNDGEPALLGAVSLEILGLGIDPVNSRLISVLNMA